MRQARSGTASGKFGRLPQLRTSWRGFWILRRPSPSIPENLSTFPGCSGGVPPASCRSAVLSDFRHSEPPLGWAGSGVGFDEPWAPTRRLPSSSPAPCGRACPAFWTRALTLCPGDACLLLQRAVSSCWLALVVRGRLSESLDTCAPGSQDPRLLDPLCHVPLVRWASLDSRIRGSHLGIQNEVGTRCRK